MISKIAQEMAKLKNEAGAADESANAVFGADERIRDDSYESRSTASSEREDNDGTSMNAEERRRMFQDEWKQDALPTPPMSSFKGFHLCWLTTTNNSDPIHARLQMGYQLVKTDEIKGWQSYGVKEGEFAGVVSCNELLLAKIPVNVYQGMMQYFHHDMPLQEEEMLRANLPTEKDSSGRDLVEQEGFNSINKRTSRVPTFT